MRRSLKLTVMALAATTLLGAALSSASARNLSFSSQAIRATWTHLDFDTGMGIIIECLITLEGSFHSRTITKTANALIGAITRAWSKQDSCTQGIAAMFNGVERYNGATTPNTLPWHLTYESFAGELPNITRIRLLFGRFRFGIRDMLGACTGQYGTAANNITISAPISGTEITSITPVEGRNIASLSRTDGGSCPSAIALRSEGQLMALNTTNRISVTLI